MPNIYHLLIDIILKQYLEYLCPSKPNIVIMQKYYSPTLKMIDSRMYNELLHRDLAVCFTA